MHVSGVGCCTVDLLCDLPPGEDRLAPWLSRAPDDGGLIRGGAVLKTAFARRAGVPMDVWLERLARGVTPRRSLGGVGVVSLIAAAQLLPPGALVEFHAAVGQDELGDFVLEQVARTPLGRARLRRRPGRSPSTFILNERHADGTAERTFVTEPGTSAALALAPEDLDADFHASDVAAFCCMQWEPRLLARLTEVVGRARRAGALTVVGTAYDPEQAEVTGRWRLGDSDEVYRQVDVLVMDRTEALRYSGEADAVRARAFFRQSGVGAFVVTDGLRPVHWWSRGAPCAAGEGLLPVPAAILEDQARGRLPTGDSVGCGDNFVGGVLAALATQRAAGGPLDLAAAVRMGNLSGALASTHAGGVLYERQPGERRGLVRRYGEAYAAQLAAGR